MRMDAITIGLLGLSLWLPAAAMAAAAAATPAPDDEVAEELDEISVEGLRERQRTPQLSFEWLSRLVGEFTIDGRIQANPNGSPGEARNAMGKALCVGFGAAPGVLCDLQVRWTEVTDRDGGRVPGGISTLDPAVMLFGFNLGSHSNPMSGSGRHNANADPESFTIAHALIDSRGVAESGTGYRAGTDTMTSRAPCIAISGNCERLVRIIAPEDLQTIEMRIDLQIDGEVATRYDLVMHRQEDSKVVVFGRKPEKEKRRRK